MTRDLSATSVATETFLLTYWSGGQRVCIPVCACVLHHACRRAGFVRVRGCSTLHLFGRALGWVCRLRFQTVDQLLVALGCATDAPVCTRGCVRAKCRQAASSPMLVASHCRGAINCVLPTRLALIVGPHNFCCMHASCCSELCAWLRLKWHVHRPSWLARQCTLPLLAQACS